MNGLTEINKNLEKSFKGTFRSALKNGYEMDKHYVIIDWVYFHKLLKQEFNIDLCYAEIGFLRDILQKRRNDLWLEQYGNRLDKNMPIDEVAKLRDDLFARHILPITDIGCCNSILLKIDDYENKIQKELKKNG